jgi:ABC-type Mn/Zn transport systems, ATPase component
MTHTPDTPVVDVRAATVAYDRTPVLTEVDLRVSAGEVVAILGPNGSGKSTLVKAILGLAPLVAGSVALFGATGAGIRRHRHRIGYVPQRLGAGSGVPATVGEVVAAGRLARRGLRPPRPADREAVARAIAAVGLTSRTYDPVSALSGGQQQRVLIARALAAEPDLLVLDEPTAGVDAASQDAFAKALQDFVSGGGTVLLVAHELGPLQPLVTRCVVIHSGRVAHDGAAPEPTGYHALPGHDHVHPHAPTDRAGIWGPGWDQ